MTSNAIFPAGTVISQSPEGNTEVPLGSAVDLVVSTGVAVVDVPPVVGLSQGDAESAIDAVGLAIGTITTESHPVFPAGSVISQNPLGNTEVPLGSSVDLVVSIGAASEVILQPSPADGKDTYFGTGSVGGREGRPDADELRIGGWGDNWTSFIEFDLSTVPPANEIIKTELHLHNWSSTNPNNGKLFRVTEPWNEADPSDTSSPAAVDYGMLYQSVPNADWWIVDVTDIVKGWKDGIYPNYGFKMLGEFTNNNHVKHFRSSDYMDDPTLRPKLIVTY